MLAHRLRSILQLVLTRLLPAARSFSGQHVADLQAYDDAVAVSSKQHTLHTTHPQPHLYPFHDPGLERPVPTAVQGCGLQRGGSHRKQPAAACRRYDSECLCLHVAIKPLPPHLTSRAPRVITFVCSLTRWARKAAWTLATTTLSSLTSLHLHLPQ